MNETIKELTLMLLYLTSWSEKGYEEDVHLAWKGYNFDILNELEEENLIDQGSRPGKRKSLYINKEGIEKARKLLEKYGINEK